MLWPCKITVLSVTKYIQKLIGKHIAYWGPIQYFCTIWWGFIQAYCAAHILKMYGWPRVSDKLPDKSENKKCFIKLYTLPLGSDVELGLNCCCCWLFVVVLELMGVDCANTDVGDGSGCCCDCGSTGWDEAMVVDDEYILTPDP